MAVLIAKSFEENLHKMEPKKPNRTAMYKESNRLKTFNTWKNLYISPKDLASDGFFYTQTDDNVECAFCQLVLGDFEEGDSVKDIHRELSSDCSYVRNRNRAGNVALDGEDVCGFDAISISKAQPKLSNGYKYPLYRSREAREKSFADWPLSMPQRPQTLSGAGFFYVDKGDRVVCFYCGLGLKDWEKHDDPYEEHAKWSPNCEYLIQKKGQEFVNTYQDAGVKQEAIASTSKKTNEHPQQNIADSKLCTICYLQEKEIAFLPCGHVCCCVDCAVLCDNCYICRKPIDSTKRIFLS